MSRRALRPQGEICQICDFLLPRHTIARQLLRSTRAIASRRNFSASRAHPQGLRKNAAPASHQSNSPLIQSKPSSQDAAPGQQHSEAELAQALQEVKAACNELLSLNRAPSGKETFTILSKCEAMASLLVYEPPSKPAEKRDATSALLSLDGSASKKIPVHKIPQSFLRMIDELSQIAYSVVESPPVFISPQILGMYVNIQSTLNKPETLPEVLHLYANKPVAQEGSSPIRYSNPSPNKVANAIHPTVAERALKTALNAKNLNAAMDIIEVCYTTTAAHRAKFVRKGLLPVTGLGLAPFAAYSAASQLAHYQDTMDVTMFTNVGFAGLMAYITFTATTAVVAVTTANDQMVRVTWAPGVPLRERWIREEERAAIDQVAVAWGFREVWRRGEEEGEDWEAIREWIGRRSMMLDRVELMEGME